MGRSILACGVVAALMLTSQAATVLAEDIAWSTDLRTAWQSSQTTNRPLMVFVTSSHCSYCRRMQAETLANAAVQRSVQDSYIPVMLDAERSADLASQLKVSGVPTTILVFPDGRIADRVSGYVSPAKLQARLEAVVRQGNER